MDGLEYCLEEGNVPQRIVGILGVSPLNLPMNLVALIGKKKEKIKTPFTLKEKNKYKRIKEINDLDEERFIDIKLRKISTWKDYIKE